MFWRRAVRSFESAAADSSSYRRVGDGADSTVICEYVEERYPEPSLLPESPSQRARSRWLEELADTRICQVFIWQLFNERVINRFV